MKSLQNMAPPWPSHIPGLHWSHRLAKRRCGARSWGAVQPGHWVIRSLLVGWLVDLQRDREKETYIYIYTHLCVHVVHRYMTYILLGWERERGKEWDWDSRCSLITRILTLLGFRQENHSMHTVAPMLNLKITQPEPMAARPFKATLFILGFRWKWSPNELTAWCVTDFLSGPQTPGGWSSVWQRQITCGHLFCLSIGNEAEEKPGCPSGCPKIG